MCVKKRELEIVSEKGKDKKMCWVFVGDTYGVSVDEAIQMTLETTDLKNLAGTLHVTLADVYEDLGEGLLVVYVLTYSVT